MAAAGAADRRCIMSLGWIDAAEAVKRYRRAHSRLPASSTFVLSLFAGLLGTAGCAPSSIAPSRVNGPRSELVAPGVALATFDSVWTMVHRSYVDTAFVSSKWDSVRDSLRPRALAVNTRDGLDQLLSATLANIPDSHFYIIPARVASEVGSPDDNGGPRGTGGTTGVAVRIAERRLLVWRVAPGSPAALAGITAGETVDRIGDRDAGVAVNRVLSLKDAARDRAASELLRTLNAALSPGVGDVVRIRVRNRDRGGTREHTLRAVPTKGTVSKFGNLPPIAGDVRAARRATRRPDGSGKHKCVGTIAFNIWLPALAAELERAVDSVSGCAGIIIDLRGNPGGVGAMVMGFGGYFVDSALVLGTMRTRDVSLKFAINPRFARASGVRSPLFAGPVAILVDPLTGSTSEIFAAGMQRLGRMRVFGERSAGAALPALMEKLPSGDVFVHAIADFTDPEGRRIEGTGVVPDETVLLTEKDLRHEVDAPFEAAVRWIEATAAARTELRK